jgi:hypothetical protein
VIVRNVVVGRVVEYTVYIRERGAGGREGAVSEALSLLSYILKYVSLAVTPHQWGGAFGGF